MKILLINKFLYPNGGSETYIFKLGEYLQKMGNEVQYFGMEHEGRCVGNRVNAYTSNMDFHSGSKLAKLTYPIKTIYSREARIQIRKVLDDFQPDVCHLNNFNYQLTPSIILEIKKWSKRFNHSCRILYTAHDCQLVCPDHLLFDPAKREICEKCLGGHYFNCIFKKCIHSSLAKSIVGASEAYFWRLQGVYNYIDAIICPSKFIKTKLDTNTQLSSKTMVINNFVDINNGIIQKVEELPFKYVLYIGRYSKEKGIETLLKCAKLTPNVNYVFAGSGVYDNQIRELDNIYSVGFRNRNELNYLIKNATVVINASECYETFGLSIGEAIMMGNCVIGTDIGAIPELIIAGINGLLFQHGNEYSLKDAINAIYYDEQFQKKLSIGSGKVSLETIQTYYNKLMKVYKHE